MTRLGLIAALGVPWSAADAVAAAGGGVRDEALVADDGPLGLGELLSQAFEGLFLGRELHLCHQGSGGDWG